MTGLDRVIPAPALVESDEIDLAATPSTVWDLVRHGDLGESALVRALFAVRTLPDRVAGRKASASTLRIDDLKSSTDCPGFQVLSSDDEHEVVVGAIGKVWHLQIPFVHVRDAEAFLAFSEPGFVKVAWALRVAPLGDRDSRLTLEVRVDATDVDAWSKFRRYFTVIGPGSHFIRRSLLESLSRRLGTPESHEELSALPGDTFLPDAATQITRGITIAATPQAIWPWLVQMGCRRAGFYGIDALDNDAVRSAREVHAELQKLAVGEVVPATPDGEDGFEVLAIEPGRALVMGGLYDADAKKQRAFSAARPEHYWQATWSFFLEPLDAATTRLHVRGRAAFPPTGRFHAEWIRPVHKLMQTAQLKHLAERVEGRLPKDDWRDVVEGIGGASIMAAAFLTPFMRGERSHWGLSPELAARPYPGDELVASPRFCWTHGVEIDAPTEEVWPWIAQLGADRGGFYSYQWLENVAGCGVRNAESIHADWAIHAGDTLRLHPRMPPLEVAALDRGHFFVAHTPTSPNAPLNGKPWADATWLFLVEPLGDKRSRLVSRYRCATSDDIATRVSFGAGVMEPIGFAMDRRMLLGVKARVEAAAAKRHPRRFARRSGTARATVKPR
jgi:hypothetical protein